MNITFADTLPDDPSLLARVVDHGAMPDDLERTVSEGANAARFRASAGQTFESFVERDGKVVRLALTGAGKPDAADRLGNLEKAGAALGAKYFASGVDTLVLDAAGSPVDAAGLGAVLLGLRLRSWRYDEHRTTMKKDQKRSLVNVVVVGAPDGSETALDDAAAVADGVEFARMLVTEPANKVYPASFVEKAQKAFEGTGVELTVLDDDDMETVSYTHLTLPTICSV